jgi:hypothetical protein
MSDVGRPKARANAFRFGVGTAPTAVDWFLTGERYDEENPEAPAQTIVVHARPGEVQPVALVDARVTHLQVAKAGTYLRDVDGRLLLQPRSARAAKTKAARLVAPEQISDNVAAVGGGTHKTWWVSAGKGAALHHASHDGGVTTINIASADKLGAFCADDDGCVWAQGQGVVVADSKRVTHVPLTTTVSALGVAGRHAWWLVDDAGRVGALDRSGQSAGDIRWLGQTTAGPFGCIGSVGDVVLLGSHQKGLFRFEGGAASVLRPSLRARCLSSSSSGLLVVCPLLVAHTDGVDFTVRDLAATIKAAEGLG